MDDGAEYPTHEFDCVDCGVRCVRSYLPRVDGTLPDRCHPCGMRRFSEKYPELGVATISIGRGARGEITSWDETVVSRPRRPPA